MPSVISHRCLISFDVISLVSETPCTTLERFHQHLTSFSHLQNLPKLRQPMRDQQLINALKGNAEQAERANAAILPE